MLRLPILNTNDGNALAPFSRLWYSVITIILLSTLQTNAAPDTLRISVGVPFELPVQLPAAAHAHLQEGKNTLEFTLTLSNPLVAFFDPPQQEHIVVNAWNRQDIDTLNANIDLLLTDTSNSSLTLLLPGRALAGNDSLCIVEVSALRLNGIPLQERLQTLLISRSVGTPLPYIRFATLEQNYPNPVRGGGFTVFPYRIDLPSDVRFVLYDIQGRSEEIAHFSNVPAGTHQFVFFADEKYLTGAYTVRLITKSGMFDRRMMILR